MPLDTWVDAPPKVLTSLKYAIEVHHTKNVSDEQIALGQHAVHKTIERKRFVWESKKSA